MDNKIDMGIAKKESSDNIPAPVWIKTCTLIAVWSCMGMSHVMTPATLPDLRDRMGVDTEEISRGLAIGNIGSFAGSLLGALADRYNQGVDVIIGVHILLSALMLITRGFITNLWVFTLNIFMDAIGWTCVNAVGNSVMMDMWGEKGGPAMHALHFGYPIGAMIGPLIAYPFVSTVTEDNSTDLNFTTVPILSTPSEDSPKFNDDSRIEIAFAIVGCIDVLVAMVFFVFQFVLPSRKMASHQQKMGHGWKTILSPSKWAGNDFRFGITMLVFMMIFYVLHIITIKGSTNFYVTYAVDSELQYTNQQATLYSSITNFAATLGRGLSIVVSRFVPIQVMFIVEVFGQSASAIFTLIWGLNGKLEFLLLNCAFCFFRDPIWPSGYAFTDRYIALYAIVVGLIDFVGKIGDISFTWFLGYLYEYTVIESLFYNTTVASIILCIHIVLITVFAVRHGNRFRIEVVEKSTPHLSETTKL